MAPIKKLSPAELMQYMLWNEKLLNYLYATSISLQLTDQSILWPVSIFIWFVYIKFGCKGEKKKSKMESVTFDSTASSIQIKASVSTAGRQTAISLQQHLPNKTSVLSADLSFWILTPKECISWAIRESSKNAITIIKV